MASDLQFEHPPEVVAEVVRLMMEGKSAREVAKALGLKSRAVASGIFTRHRDRETGPDMDARRREVNSITHKMRARKRSYRGEALKKILTNQARAKGLCVDPQPKPEGLPTNLREVPADQMRLTLHSRLEHHQCSWPVGEPTEDGYLCCGRNRLAGPRQRYCPEHQQLVQPANYKHMPTEELVRSLRKVI